jgi:hypothetical protein
MAACKQETGCTRQTVRPNPFKDAALLKPKKAAISIGEKHRSQVAVFKYEWARDLNEPEIQNPINANPMDMHEQWVFRVISLPRHKVAQKACGYHGLLRLGPKISQRFVNRRGG